MEFSPVFDPPTWREEYRELFESKNVNDAREYVEQYGNEPLDTDHELRDLIDGMGADLHGFERIYPVADQDLALVFINPGLNWRGSQQHLDDNLQLSRADPTDWTRRCAISMDGGFKYLTSHNEDHSAFGRLRKILRKIGEETSVMSELAATMKRPVEFFADVYYTNWYKYATYSVGKIDGEIKDTDSFVSEQLRKELNAVDPELVLLLGKQPWVYGLRSYSTPLTGAPSDARISESQNHLFKCDLSDSSFYVLPFNHPSDRNRSRAVGLDSGRFGESLRRFKKEASI